MAMFNKNQQAKIRSIVCAMRRSLSPRKPPCGHDRSAIALRISMADKMTSRNSIVANAFLAIVTGCKKPSELIEFGLA